MSSAVNENVGGILGRITRLPSWMLALPFVAPIAGALAFSSPAQADDGQGDLVRDSAAVSFEPTPHVLAEEATPTPASQVGGEDLALLTGIGLMGAASITYLAVSSRNEVARRQATAASDLALAQGRTADAIAAQTRWEQNQVIANDLNGIDVSVASTEPVAGMKNMLRVWIEVANNSSGMIKSLSCDDFVLKSARVMQGKGVERFATAQALQRGVGTSSSMQGLEVRDVAPGSSQRLSVDIPIRELNLRVPGGTLRAAPTEILDAVVELGRVKMLTANHGPVERAEVGGQTRWTVGRNAQTEFGALGV